MTKERIRQIEARALSKLRQAAQEEKIVLDTRVGDKQSRVSR